MGLEDLPPVLNLLYYKNNTFGIMQPQDEKDFHKFTIFDNRHLISENLKPLPCLGEKLISPEV